MLEVEPTGRRGRTVAGSGRETAAKTSPPGVASEAFDRRLRIRHVDMPRSNDCRRVRHVVEKHDGCGLLPVLSGAGPGVGPSAFNDDHPSDVPNVASFNGSSYPLCCRDKDTSASPVDGRATVIAPNVPSEN